MSEPTNKETTLTERMDAMESRLHEKDLRLAAVEQELSTLIMLFQEEDEIEMVTVN